MFSAYLAHWSSYFSSVAFHAPFFRFRCASFSASSCSLYLGNPLGIAPSVFLFPSRASRVSGTTSLLFSSRSFSSLFYRPVVLLQSSSKAARHVRRRQQKKTLSTSSSSLPSKTMETRELHCAFPLDTMQRSSDASHPSAMCSSDPSHPPRYPRSKRNVYYCVARGREVGIYMSWEHCSAQVMGFKGAVFKKFPSLEEARAFLLANRAPPSSSNAEQGETTISRLHSPISAPMTTTTGHRTASLREGSTSSGKEEISTMPTTCTSSSSTTTPHAIPALTSTSRKRRRSSSPTGSIPALPSSKRTSSSASVSPFLPSKRSDGEGSEGRGVRNVLDATLSVGCRGIPGENSDTEEEKAGVLAIPSSEVPPLSLDDAALLSSPLGKPAVIYVDGACSHNGKGGGKAKGGYGVFYGPDDRRNVAKPLPPYELQTNNRAELYAVIYAIQAALDAQQQEEYSFIRMVANTLSESKFFKEANELCQYQDQLRRIHEEKVRSGHEGMVKVGGTPCTLPFTACFPAGNTHCSLMLPPHVVTLHQWWELEKRLHYFLQLLHPNDARLLEYSPCLLAQLQIYTDSKYVMEGLLSYCKTWERKGFRRAGSNKTILNEDLWRQLTCLRDVYNTVFFAQQWVLQRYPLEKTGDPLFPCSLPNSKDPNTATATASHSAASHSPDESRSSFFSIPLPKVFTPSTTKNTKNEGILMFHVKGHSNVYGNVQADRLAVMGAQMRDEV